MTVFIGNTQALPSILTKKISEFAQPFKWGLAILFLVTFSALQAQPIQITVSASPPYSVHVADYINNSDNIFVTLTNTTNNSYNVKLISSMTGDNGVTIAMNEQFQPQSPIVVQNFQSLTFSLSQLQVYNNNISSSNLDVTGYPKQKLLKTETLPEGNYTLCVKAYNYNNGNLLSNDFGCTVIPITYFDPPVVLLPTYDEKVTPLNPQNINFTWSPTGQPGLTRYKFSLVDMTKNGLFNPNDAFNTPAIQPYVMQDIITSQLNYNVSFPPLQENHKYAIQVTAYDPDGIQSFKNEGRSPISTFYYKQKSGGLEPNPNNEISNNNQAKQVNVMLDPDKWLKLAPPPNDDDNPPALDPQDTPGCLGDCATPAVPQIGNVQVKVGDDVTIGKFKMRVVTVANNTGTGTIFVNWLKAPIKVKFNGISVNNNMQLYAGEVYAVIDEGGIAESIAKNENADLSQLNQHMGDIATAINQASRRISNFLPNNDLPIGLPLALNNQDFDLAIVGIIFKPNTAFMNVALPVQIPDALNGEYLNIATSGICIRPNGMGAAGKISLAKDVNIPLTNLTTLTFKKTQTVVDFDCTGVTAAHIEGQLTFDRELLLPVSNANEVTNGEVMASFAVDILDKHNWMAENVTLSPTKFTTAATRGFVFTAANLKYDHSDVANPQNIDFPENYPNKNNTWQGLYIQTIGCQLPDGFQQGNDPLSVEGLNFFIDKYGFTAEINGQNLIDFNTGKLDGWKFSMDEFGLHIMQSALESGSFAGDVRLPISETALSYSVAISAPQQNNQSVDFEFAIGDLPDLEVDMWMANMSLENSTVTLTKQNNKYKVGAILNGGIAIAWGSGENAENNAVSSFGLPSLEFQGLEIGGGQVPSITNGAFGIVNNIQAQCATFPVTLSDINFQFNGPEVGIQFVDLGFTLTNQQNGLTGNTGFTIYGEWNPQAGVYKYKKTQLQSIYVNADLVAAKIEGTLDIYSEDQTYGNGFRGSLDATVKMTNTSIAVTLQVGKTLGQNSFRYFYFDALVDLGDNLGIPLGATGVALYGFGGGMWYNMNRNSPFDENNPIMIDGFNGEGYANEIGATESGITFTPAKNKLGFSASVLFGIYQARDVFNGDLEFGMQLDYADLSLEQVYMNGSGYAMQSPTGDRTKESAVIAGTVNILIDATKPMFHCNVGIQVGLGGIVKGGATMAMHYEALPNDNKLWYFKIGEWDEQSTFAQDFPWEDEKRFHVSVDLEIVKAVFHGYFMTGNAIPELPPLPKVIRDNLGDLQDDRDPIDGNTPAMGIAMGAGLYAELDLTFLVFYADIKFTFGADVVIKNYQGVSCGDIDPIGINGWYAKGQGYGYFYGSCGMEVDLWFFEGRAELMTLELTAGLFAQGPNPMYAKGKLAIEGSLFNGLIKVQTSFQAEVGTKCDLPEYNPFEDIPIVSEILPGDGDKNVKTSSDINVAYNFPNGTFTIDEYDSDGNLKIRSLGYKIKRWELRHSNNVLAWQNTAYKADGYSMKSIQKDYMPGNANIKYFMEVQGKEYTDGMNKVLTTQTYEGTFKTGPNPDYIEPSNVKAMRPLGGKRFVLQEEYNSGYIKLKKGPAPGSKLFSPGSLATGHNSYVAKFRVLSTNQVSAETPMNWNDDQNKVEFTMPHNLANEKIYAVEITRIHTKPINQITSNTNTKDTYYKHYLTGGPGGKGYQGGDINKLAMPPQNQPNKNKGLQQIQLNLNAINKANNKFNLNLPLAEKAPPKPPAKPWQVKGGLAIPGNKKDAITIELLDRELLEKSNSEKVEKILYTYYWKTSKYNNWTDKINAANFVKGTEAHSVTTEWKNTNVETHTQVNVLYLKIPENIDRYDAYGFTYWIGNQKTKLPPGLTFGPNMSNNNWMPNQWNNGHGDPWDAPDPEDWGNPIYLQDEYNEPIAYNLDQFPDFDAYWPDPFNDWTPDRFDDKLKGNAMFNKRDYPIPQGYNAWQENAPVEIYNPLRHGIINLDSPITLPAGNLTTNEVQAAKNKAPKPQDNPPPNLNKLALNNGGNGGGFNLNLNLQNNMGDARIAILELQDWVVAHDYTWMREFIISGITDKLESYPQNSGQYYPFLHKTWQPIYFWLQSDNIWPPHREHEYSWLKLNGIELEYETKPLN